MQRYLVYIVTRRVYERRVYPNDYILQKNNKSIYGHHRQLHHDDVAGYHCIATSVSHTNVPFDQNRKIMVDFSVGVGYLVKRRKYECLKLQTTMAVCTVVSS